MSGEFPPFSTTTVHDVRVINRSRWVIIYSSTCWLCTFHWCESTCWLSTSHESVRQHANSTYCPRWCWPPLSQHSIHALRHSLYFRDDVTEVTPGDKGVTYIQVRVIDWLDLYPGQSDWLTRDGLVTGHLAADGATCGSSDISTTSGMTSQRLSDWLTWPISRLIDTWRKLL